MNIIKKLTNKYLLIFLALITLFGASAFFKFYVDFILFEKIRHVVSVPEKYEKQIFSDFKNLEKFPAFKKSDYSKDAKDFLNNALITNESQIKPNESKKIQQNKAIQSLFNENPDWLNKTTDLNKLTSDSRFLEAEPKWVEKILAFNHWSNNKVEDPEIIKNSDVMLLVNWVSIYVIKKIQQKDLQAGLKIFRHTAELINTRGDLNSQIFATNMLKTEHKLVRNYQAKQWELVPLTSIEAYKRLTWAWFTILKQAYFSAFKYEFEKYLNPQFGVCASVDDSYRVSNEIRFFLNQESSLEKNYAPAFIKIEDLQQTILKNCKQSLSNVAKTATFEIHHYWPVYRQFLGLKKLETLNANSINLYSEEKQKDNN